MRIDKYICDTINITRTQAKNKISKGVVWVDGVRVRSGSLQVDETACVEVDGIKLNYNKYVYIMMNKPAGVISASSDSRSKTAIDLLNDEDKRHDLFIAGRLDKDTTGLLLITNDGGFAHDILSPKKHVFKTYQVELEHACKPDYKACFEDGVILEDGYKCKPAIIDITGDRSCLLKINEGKFHQIKRMFEAMGNCVVALKRIAIDFLELDEDLKPGEYRYFNDLEVEKFMNKITKNAPKTKKSPSE